MTGWQAGTGVGPPARPHAADLAGPCPVCAGTVEAIPSTAYAGLVELGRHDNHLVPGYLIAPVCIGSGQHVKPASAGGKAGVMTGDRAIRAGTAAVVLAVAGFAAIVSYSHIYDLGRAHGQSGTAARLLPLSVDGLIVAAGLVLLHAARRQAPVPVLARCMLWLGIAAAVGANVAYGAAYGMLGAVISAWPAVAFVGAAELALGMVRSASEYGSASVPEPHPAALGNGHAAPEGAPDAARLYAAELAAGELPSVRRIRREMHVGQDRAQSVQAYLAALAP